MFKDMNGNMFSVSRSSVPLRILSAIFRSPFLVLFSVIECSNIHLVKEKNVKHVGV